MNDTNTAQVLREREVKPVVRLLYVCDFPPSNLAGGSILMSRLLGSYPPDRIVVLTGSHYNDASPLAGRLCCDHLVFPTTSGWGRWGLGRLKGVLDWLLLPFLALKVLCLVRHRRISSILSLAHGRFFLAGAFAASLTGIPFILVVHDDWVTPVDRASSFLGHILRRLSRLAVRKASYIYAVSPEMQQFLKREYGVDSAVQMPGADSRSVDLERTIRPQNRTPVIVYAGAATDAVEDSLKLLAKVVTQGKLQEYGIPLAQLCFYTPMTEQKVRDWGWDHPSIKIQPWATQQELPAVLAAADLLFLPFSFSEAARYAVEYAFPSKTADYLASGRPILVFGPPYSSLVRYAREHRFAEIVDQFTPGALALGIWKIISSPAHQEQLGRASLSVFMKNHDITRQRQAFIALLLDLTEKGRSRRIGSAVRARG